MVRAQLKQGRNKGQTFIFFPFSPFSYKNPNFFCRLKIKSRLHTTHTRSQLKPKSKLILSPVSPIIQGNLHGLKFIVLLDCLNSHLLSAQNQSPNRYLQAYKVIFTTSILLFLFCEYIVVGNICVF